MNDTFNVYGRPVYPPAPETPVSGVEGYIQYEDTTRPEQGKITVAVDSFAQMRKYMGYLTSSSRFQNVSWYPAALPSRPPQED